MGDPKNTSCASYVVLPKETGTSEVTVPKETSTGCIIEPNRVSTVGANSTIGTSDVIVTVPKEDPRSGGVVPRDTGVVPRDTTCLDVVTDAGGVGSAAGTPEVATTTDGMVNAET